MVPTRAALRVSAAWGLPGLLDEAGVSLEDVLDDAELSHDLFSSRENVVTYPQLERLFHACERRTQCDHFGLLVGQRSRLADMGLAGEAARNAPTAGEGLRTFIDHFNLHDTAAACALIDFQAHTRFVYTVLEPGLPDTRHFQFGGITIALNILQDLCGPGFVPTEVSFASRAPSNVRIFQKHFQAPVHFDEEESALTFEREWLSQPLRPVDAKQRAQVESAIAEQYRSMLADFPAVVRRIVRKQMLLGDFTMDDIAAMLSMHRRTLDRHLQEHGVQYGELLEGVKEEIARQLLRETSMPIQRIAETVRFSSAANFATAFRRRVGMTPSAYRRS